MQAAGRYPQNKTRGDRIAQHNGKNIGRLGVFFCARMCYTDFIQTRPATLAGAFFMPRAMLPERALPLLAAAFPGQEIQLLAPTAGGFSHPSAFLAIGGRRCVAKAAEAAPKRAGLRHEAAVLRALAGHGVAAPALLALCEDAEWTVEVLAALPGEPGMACYGRAPAEQDAALAALAGLLAATHAAPLAPLAGARLPERAAEVRAQLPALDLDPAVQGALAGALAQPIWQAEAGRLVHGDAGLHNLLWHPAAPALLDWELAAWGQPLLDLAWVWWTLRWRDLPAARWHAFLAAYHAAGGGRRAARAEDMRALVLGQIAGLLVRSQGQPPALAEWQRRAAWSLALAVPGIAL